MEVLNSGRLGLASGCVGLCKRVIKMAVERCQERRAFGRPIGEFGLIKDKIATMMADTWALECMTYLTTGHGRRRASTTTRSRAPSARCTAARRCWRVVNESLQIAAGIGYMADYPYERLLRDARINLIFEGTNEILRAFIALSGMQGPGRELADVARAMREPIKGFGLLSDFAIRKARTALGRERMTRAPPAPQPRGGRLRGVRAGARAAASTRCCASTGGTSPRCSTRRSAWPTWRSTSTPSPRASRARRAPSRGAARKARGARST